MPRPGHGPAREWPLAVILTLRFSLVAAVSVIALALVIGLQIVPSLQDDIEQQQQALAHAVVSQVESYFSVADRELKALAVVLAVNQHRSGELNRLLDSYVGASSFYEAIYLTDVQGRVGAIGLPAVSQAVRQNFLGLDLSQRDFVHEARRLNAPVWSNSFLSPVSLRLSIAIAIPVGPRMLIGEVAVTPLPAFARKLAAGSELMVMMLDRKNQLTAHSGNAYADQQMNFGHLPLVAAARAGSKSTQTEFDFDGQRLVGSAWPVTGLDWLVVVAQPTHVAYAPIDAIWKRFLGGIVFAILAALAAAIWTSRALSKQFMIYNAQAGQIAGGQYQLHQPDSLVREFNQLRDSLQRMAAAIQDREAGMHQARASLLELNATLEQRVAQRTDQLTHANQELISTLDTLQRAQSELFRAEKLAALGSMVAGIAHELNTPIGNSVMVASTLADHDRELQREMEAGSLRRSMLDRHLSGHLSATDILLRNLQRASDLIKSFKQVAVDQTSAQRRTFRLDEAVAEIILTLHPMVKKMPLQVSIEIDDTIWLDSYPGALGQVITNLVSNAVVHAFAGKTQGTIHIQGQGTDIDWLALSVSDDGNGIAPENLGKVFDPFFTTRLGQGGSGLGLSIVYSLVTKVLGGSIFACSEPGAGTQFKLRLPKRAPGSVAESPA